MQITEEQLKEIEELSHCYMQLDEIALITEIPLEVIENDDLAHKHFIIGRLKRKAEFNGKLIQLSNQLSSPAMNIESKIAEETYLKDKLRK